MQVRRFFSSLIAVLVLVAVSSGASAAEAELTVEDAGDEPRRELRYTPEVGDTQRVEMRMRMSMTMRMQGFEMPPTVIPEVTYTTVFTVDEVEGDLIRYSGEYVDVTMADGEGVEPALRQQMQAELDQIRGATFSAEMTNRGILREAEFDGAGGDMMQSLEQTIDQLGMPLPEEPVGVGARWTSKSQPTMEGITMDQTVTAELRSMEDERVTIHADLEMTAEDQQVEVEEAPGAEVRIVQMRSTGSIDSDIDLTRLLPESAVAETEMNAEMEINAGQGVQAMEQQMEMVLEIQPADE